LLDTKNGESRSIPISSKIESLLTYLKLSNSNSRYLFPSTKGDSPRFIRKAWCTAVEKADIKDFRFHDLRHTAASYLAMNGATLMELSHILGHKTLQMVKRYAHLTDQHTADLIEKMNNKIRL
jgi:integrase